TAPGITNSCGVLAQHLIGNLSYYVGVGIAKNGYQRNREQEFTNTGVSTEQLITGITETSATVDKALAELKPEQLGESFSLYKSANFNTAQMLIHLHGHLNYHLGQVNYLRRMLNN